MSDTFNLANSIWPNGMKVDSSGHAVFYPLGTNKVDVPTSSSEWPEGTKLISPFVYDENNKLVGFADTKAMTASEPTTINLPYTHVEVDFSAIDKGMLTITAPNASVKKVLWSDGIFEDIVEEINFKYKGCKTVDDVKAVDYNYKTTDIVNGVWSESLADLEQGGNGQYGGGMFFDLENLTSFTSDLSSLTNGFGMFLYCGNLTSFTADLSSLMDGSIMFAGCINLTTFSSDSIGSPVNLSSLTNGFYMFSDCNNLESFSSELPSLMDGYYMFNNCIKLTSFPSDLPNLTNGEGMFYGCSALTAFSADLSSLTNANMMFYNSNLESFSSDLSSLTNGSGMFYNCKLNTASVQHIADTINTPSSKGTILIDIANSTPNSQEEAAFNKIASKNWTVYANGYEYSGSGYYGYAASASLTTLDETGETEMFTPKPYWAKPVPSDEEHAKYVDSEGNFFNILGAQFIYGDNLETYGMFTCEEDAAANMRLTPYIKPIEN